jgi:hypothetical protein
VQQKPPQKLVGRQGHELLVLFVFVVFISKRDSSVLQFFQTVVGDGDPVMVSNNTEPSRRLTYRYSICGKARGRGNRTPAKRVSGVLGMLSSLEVKVLCPT